MKLAVPKQARALATRVRIIIASAEALTRRGHHGTSTTTVAEAAGVSQGALFKHFPTKALLLAATVAELLAHFVADFRDALPAAPRKGTLAVRVRPAIAALWGIFRRREMQAVLEVYVAARTDPTLAALLSPILERHREAILGEAARLFPELSGGAEFASVVDAVVAAMQGTIVGLFGPEAEDDAKHLAFFERLALRELEAAFP